MTTTREQRLRELVSQWKRECMVFADMPNSVPVPKRLYLWNRIDELAAILAEPVEVSEEMLTRGMYAWLKHSNLHPKSTVDALLHAALTAALKEPGQ